MSLCVAHDLTVGAERVPAHGRERRPFAELPCVDLDRREACVAGVAIRGDDRREVIANGVAVGQVNRRPFTDR
jgi:hypothetical protein